MQVQVLTMLTQYQRDPRPPRARESDVQRGRFRLRRLPRLLPRGQDEGEGMAHGMPAVSHLVCNLPCPYQHRTALNQDHFSLFSGHIYLQPWHIKPGVKERLLKDIREVAKELMEAPKEKLEGRVCG